MKNLLYFLVLVPLVSACTTHTVTHIQTPTPHVVSEEEVIKKMHEAMLPKEEHKKLEALSGEWTTESKYWNSPDSPPEISKGRASHSMILGKRFVQEKYYGKWMNMPYEGFGLMGYDNLKKAYVSTWLDTMGTSMMESEGNFNQATNSIEMVNTYTCPVSYQSMKGRSVIKFISPKEYMYEMYAPGKDNKEVKVMEVIYKKKK